MEAQIFPLAVNLDEPENAFNRDFFYETPNSIQKWISGNEGTVQTLRLLAVADYRPGYHLNLAMDDEAGQAVAYLAADKSQSGEKLANKS